MGEAYRGYVAAGKANGHDVCTPLHTFHGVLELAAAHAVQHHIHTCHMRTHTQGALQRPATMILG